MLLDKKSSWDVYHRQPPPDLDTLPDPARGALGDHDPDPYPHWPNEWANPTSCYHQPVQPPPPAPAPPPPAAADTDDEIPPF